MYMYYQFVYLVMSDNCPLPDASKLKLRQVNTAKNLFILVITELCNEVKKKTKIKEICQWTKIPQHPVKCAFHAVYLHKKSQYNLL